jgi:hypothetical protein
LGTWVAGNEELETWYLYCAVINIKETTKCASENFKLKPLRQRERSGGGLSVRREKFLGKIQKAKVRREWGPLFSLLSCPIRVSKVLSEKKSERESKNIFEIIFLLVLDRETESEKGTVARKCRGRL